MRGADLFILVTYFATMLAVGFAYSRQKSCDMYFAGDRQVSWWLGGVSFFFSNLSAFAIIVYAGLGYQFGVVSLTLLCFRSRRPRLPPSFSPVAGDVPE